MFERNVRKVAYCKKSKGGPTFADKKILVQCDTRTRVPLLLRFRHQDQKSALTTRPSGSEKLIEKNEELLVELTVSNWCIEKLTKRHDCSRSFLKKSVD